MIKYSSFWLDIPHCPRPALTNDLETDVVIIGGGITGVSAAYHCAKRGFKTVLLERDTIASGSAGKNGGMVVEGLSDDLFESIDQTTSKKAVASWNRTKDAQELVKKLIEMEHLDCDFKEVGSAYTGVTNTDREKLEKEMRARTKYHIQGEYVSGSVGSLFGRFTSAILNPKDAVLQPVKFVRGLAMSAERYGAHIYEQTPALTIEKQRILTPSGTIRAKKIILALESDTPDLTKKDGYLSREGALVTQPLSRAAQKRLNWTGSGMFWNTSKNYLTVRKIDNRLFACNGAPFRSSQKNADRHTEVLLKELYRAFPALQADDIQPSHYWTGMLYFPYALEPVIKKTGSTYRIYGHGGLGLTNATQAGYEVAHILT